MSLLGKRLCFCALNFSSESFQPFFVRVIGDGRGVVDHHLDPLLVVVVLALRLGHELEEGILDGVQFSAKLLGISIENRAQILGRKSDQLLSSVIEEGDPLKEK